MPKTIYLSLLAQEMPFSAACWIHFSSVLFWEAFQGIFFKCEDRYLLLAGSRDLSCLPSVSAQLFLPLSHPGFGNSPPCKLAWDYWSQLKIILAAALQIPKICFFGGVRGGEGVSVVLTLFKVLLNS